MGLRGCYLSVWDAIEMQLYRLSSLGFIAVTVATLTLIGAGHSLGVGDPKAPPL